MKHIFTVHSPITFLCAYGIVKTEQIPEEDVIILTASNYSPPVHIGQIIPAFQDTQKKIWDKVKNWFVPKAYDNYINAIIQSKEFVAYIDLMSAYQRLLITHKRCLQFHFMEEGTMSYALPTDFNILLDGFDKMKENFAGGTKQAFRAATIKSFLIGLLRICRGHSLHLLSLPFIPQAYAYFNNTNFFTFSEDCFPGVAQHKKKVIEINRNNLDIANMALNLKLDHAIVWVEESFTFAYNIPDTYYHEAIQKSLEKISALYSGYKHYIKLRPRQKVGASPMLNVLRSAGYSPEVLDNNIMIEPLLMRSSDCIVVGSVSSVLYYAVIFGHKALSMFDLIPNKPVTFFDELDCYWEKVKRLKSS